MKKYVLITVMACEIYKPEFFDTKEEAHQKMWSYAKEVLENCNEATIEEDSAHGECYGAYYDWQIFEVELEE